MAQPEPEAAVRHGERPGLVVAQQLRLLPAGPLQVAVGIVTGLGLAAVVTAPRLRAKPRLATSLGAGAVSGFTTAIAGAGGPRAHRLRGRDRLAAATVRLDQPAELRNTGGGRPGGQGPAQVDRRRARHRPGGGALRPGGRAACDRQDHRSPGPSCRDLPRGTGDPGHRAERSRPLTGGHVPRYLSTARTRRWSVPVGGRSSLRKMFVTYFSTALGLTFSSPTIPVLERPSAISRSTCSSRGVSRSIGSSRRRATSCATTSGSRAVPPAATRRTASRKSVTCATRSLSRYPTELVAADSRSVA